MQVLKQSFFLGAAGLAAVERGSRSSTVVGNVLVYRVRHPYNYCHPLPKSSITYAFINLASLGIIVFVVKKAENGNNPGEDINTMTKHNVRTRLPAASFFMALKINFL